MKTTTTILALSALLTGCNLAKKPDSFSSITAHIGSAEERAQFGGQVHLFRDRKAGFFMSLGLSGDFKDYPEYPVGTAAGFGDPEKGVQKSAVGLGLGPTWGWELSPSNGKARKVGVFGGPYFGVKSEEIIYDDPTNILEQGQGGYTEGTGESDMDFGGIVGVQYFHGKYVVGVQYDSFHQGVALSLGASF